eukprot:scaffold169012_cov25-Tisochrysis_lutea.AAC.4
MSSIRSASSRMSTATWLTSTRPRPIMSSSRPGVATSSSQPRSSSRNWSTIGAPPKATTGRTPVPALAVAGRQAHRHQARDGGQEKGGRLARACLRASHDVASSKRGGDRVLLNRSRPFVACSPHVLADRLGQLERVEGVERRWRSAALGAHRDRLVLRKVDATTGCGLALLARWAEDLDLGSMVASAARILVAPAAAP